MLGPLFVFPLLAIVCLGALWRPTIGVIGYYGFVLLMPEWNWRWSIPADLAYQKYIAAATLIGFVLSGLRGNRWTTSAGLACTLLGVFLALAFVAAQFSILPTKTAFYLDIIWKIVLMAVLAVRVLDTPNSILAGLWTAMLAQGYNAYQINEHYFRTGISWYAYRNWGNKGDNNLYSIFTVPVMGISAAIMFGSKTLWMKILAGVIFTLQLHQIMLMQSRGCMLGSLVMAPVLLWFMPKTPMNWTAVATALLLGGTLAGPMVTEEFLSSFKSEGERDSSAQSRFDLWKAGAAITADYPFLGVGPYAGQRLVPQYAGYPVFVKGLHNLLFEVSTGCGIPATICYFSFFGISWLVAARALTRRRRSPLPEWAEICYLAVVTGLVGYMASSMFSSGALLETSYMLAAFGLATSMILSASRGWQNGGIDGEEFLLSQLEIDHLAWEDSAHEGLARNTNGRWQELG